MSTRHEYEPEIPSRECDFVVDRKNENETWTWEFYVEEMLFVGDIMADKGGEERRAWSLRENDDGSMEYLNNIHGNWMYFGNSASDVVAIKKYRDYVIEKTLLGQL